MIKRLIFSLILFFCTGSYVLAVYPSVRNFNRKVYKAGTQNWDIVQTKNDWMYFANNKGMLEFDGNRWALYPIKNYTNVRSLYYDHSSDRIYAGAFNEFGYYARKSSGILEYFSLVDKVKPKDRTFNEIWHINKIDNTIYFQGDKEIFRYKSNTITRFGFQGKIDYSAVVHNLYVISNTQEGPSFINGNIFMKFPNSDILKNKKICAILPYQTSKILFVTDFNGIYIYDGEKVAPLKTNIDNFMSENQVFCATIRGNKLALGTVRKGLVVHDLASGSNIFSNTFSGMQNNTILSMAFDNQNNLWLGLDKGIDYVLINSPIYDLFGNGQLYGAGYASVIKNSLLYLGTNQGLYATHYPVSQTPDPLLLSLLPHMQGQVWSLSVIDNTLFCGTDHGAYIINGQTSAKIPEVSGTWAFRKLFFRPGYILGCSYQGFFILKKTGNDWKFSNFVKGFDDTGGMFEEDKQGFIWFNHWIKGIYRMHLSSDLTRFDRVVQYGTKDGFPSNRDNTLYLIKNKVIFSTQYGFFEFNQKKNKVEHSREIESIFGIRNHSMKLSETPEGDIWCTSYSYIGRAEKLAGNHYRVDSLSYTSLKDKLINGFENLNFINRNTSIISTEDGFSWVETNKHLNKSNFKVAVRNVYLTNEGDSLVAGYHLFGKDDDVPQFDYAHNSVRFEFVAPEYRSEATVTYSYLLENYDTKWSAYSTVNIKEYTKLHKGVYVFRVRAKSLLESQVAETSYTFEILPPWYESKVAYFIYLILIVAGVFVLLRFIQYRSDQGAREMKVIKEKELKEQEIKYEEDARMKQKEIMELKNQRLQHDLRHKSQELANSTMNLIRKNEILLEISSGLTQVTDEIHKKSSSTLLLKQISEMQDDIRQNIKHDDYWKRFSENFDLVYENYLKRLGDKFPDLTVSDKKLCAYLKMDLSSKEIAPLLNISYRSVEMSRYRLRKKLNLDRDENLTDFLQKF